MSQSFIGICELSPVALHIHAFLKLGICVEREDVMFSLLLNSVRREPYRCFMALLVRDVRDVCLICLWQLWLEQCL